MVLILCASLRIFFLTTLFCRSFFFDLPFLLQGIGHLTLNKQGGCEEDPHGDWE